MNTYEEMYRALSELCKNEGLHLIEAGLGKNNLIYVYLDEERKMVWNNQHPKYSGKKSLKNKNRVQN